MSNYLPPNKKHQVSMIAESPWSVDEFRKRIQAMSDEKLIRFGKGARQTIVEKLLLAIRGNR
jgi:hypothetical protein